MFRSIFRDTVPRRSSFCHQDWDFVLVAGLFALSRSKDDPLHVTSQFEALHRAMHATGDRELVVTDVAVEPWHRWACTVPCDWREFIRAHFGPEPDVLLFACNRAIFGPGGQWGAITYQGYTERRDMPDYAMLGGSKTFMSIFVDACGGYAELRRRFVNHLSFDPLPGWPSLPDDVREGVLADVGWDSRTNPTQ